MIISKFLKLYSKFAVGEKFKTGKIVKKIWYWSKIVSKVKRIVQPI